MTQAKPNPLPEENIARIVKIKPGSSAEKSLKLILPDSLADATIEDVIRHALDSTSTRGDERIAERVKVEMNGTYGTTVNANPVQGKEKVSDYFVERTTEGGLKYKEVEIVVASKQEGGLETYLR